MQKISYGQCVDVATPKLTSVKDKRPETDVHPENSGMDAIGRHEALREPSLMIVAIPVRYRVSFSTALISQLQLWQLR